METRVPLRKHCCCRFTITARFLRLLSWWICYDNQPVHGSFCYCCAPVFLFKCKTICSRHSLFGRLIIDLTKIRLPSFALNIFSESQYFKSWQGSSLPLTLQWYFPVWRILLHCIYFPWLSFDLRYGGSDVEFSAVHESGETITQLLFIPEEVSESTQKCLYRLCS